MKTVRSLLLWLANWLDSSRFSRLRVISSDLYYVGRYGVGRYPGGAWFYRGRFRLRLVKPNPDTYVYTRPARPRGDAP